jgi:glycine oxidase
MEDAGFHAHPTAAGIAEVIATASRLWRPAAEARFVEAWAGLRPGSPDGWPSIGMTAEDGLMAATGHLRNGILLAPGTARLVGDLVAGRAPRIDPGPFSPSRPAATSA